MKTIAESCAIKIYDPRAPRLPLTYRHTTRSDEMSERVSWAADVVEELVRRLPFAGRMADQVEKWIPGIRRSVKFNMPEGSLLGFKEGQDITEFLSLAMRLPYPEICVEIKRGGGHKYLMYAHEYDDENGAGWVCWSFVYADPGEFEGFPAGWHPLGPSGGVRNGEFVVTEGGDLAGHPAVIVELCAALACKNVFRHEHVPPEKLNKKRVAKGALPYDSYYTLHIGGEDGERDYVGIGSGRHPRMHLRRGHIRRIAKGIVWVNAAIVNPGPGGKIVKDYAVAV